MIEDQIFRSRLRWCKGCRKEVPVLLEAGRDAWNCQLGHTTTGLDEVKRGRGR